jgi:3-polyprenyl-4-hydroxybenzoate decarboxylase
MIGRSYQRHCISEWSQVAPVGVGCGQPADMIPEITGKNANKVRMLDDQDLTCPVTSGSYPTKAVIIAPLAVGALSRIASGASTCSGLQTLVRSRSSE